MTIDAVVPARNEETTVAAVVAACLGCTYVREVIVVDDGSDDATAEVAAAAGAKIVSRLGDGSKAHAMRQGWTPPTRTPSSSSTPTAWA